MVLGGSIYAYKNRGITKYITVLDGNGNAITLESGDKIRAIIGREGKLGETNNTFPDAEFYVDSDAATAAGSSFTKGTPTSSQNSLRIDASDLAFSPGVYTMIVDVYDDDDTDEWKNVDRFVFVLEET